ncbi:hypothetical protein MFAL_07520 [Mycolicibacterium fallax]|nr:hypothetical protein MFAL_07520 [Mycolicibacterium fallax]
MIPGKEAYSLGKLGGVGLPCRRITNFYGQLQVAVIPVGTSSLAPYRSIRREDGERDPDEIDVLLTYWAEGSQVWIKCSRNCQYLWIGVFQATSVPAC